MHQSLWLPSGRPTDRPKIQNFCKKLGFKEYKRLDNNIYYEIIGNTQKDYFEIDGELKISVKELFKLNNEWYNNY